jgi:2-polyprenyl-6-methoxyphenol hydroxylase-like FAD-dependent oxidoreductase
LANADPVGPCSYYRGSDSWLDHVAEEGVVLVGDAAGWSDPIIGEGLSVALRDARTVSDVLLASDDWSVAAFEGYATERAERMRRLRVVSDVTTEIRCTFTPEGSARRATFGGQIMSDPLLLGLMLSGLIGPETGPEESFTEENVERILAFA